MVGAAAGDAGPWRIECASPRSERPVHDVQAHISMRWVAKRLRHRGEYLEAEGAPQPDGQGIGLYHAIKLHGPVTVAACLVKHVTPTTPAHAPLPPPRA